MSDRSEMLKMVMRETGTTQSALARISGVRQPSISQFLSGKVDFSDDQLERLLSCAGYRLEITRRAVAPKLTRSERRSWLLHRRLAGHLTRSTLVEWKPTIMANLQQLRDGVAGQPHVRNVERWQSLVESSDVSGLHRVLTGLSRTAIEMREVSPLSGLLPDGERLSVLQELA
jgi:transcriptional regulator with XRE-family HTH domain